MMRQRRRAREMAIQMLYQQEQGGGSLSDVFANFDLSSFLEETETPSDPESSTTKGQAQESFERARQLVEGTLGNLETIDDVIRDQAVNWRLERMPTIDRNILRLAAYEMFHNPNVPKVVVVDEAIELAKKFGSEDSGRFVNGLLDGILNSHRLEKEALAGPRQATDGSA